MSNQRTILWENQIRFGSKSDIKIERFVPLYPFSKDIEKFNNLIKILTFYRLTFGQPRQEELVEALDEYGFDEEAIKKLDDLIINLTPIRFFETKKQLAS